MPYISNTGEQRKEMLAEIGVADFESLLDAVPADVRSGELRLPEGLSEMETLEKLRALAARNTVFPPGKMFAGGGIYNHYIPPVSAQLSTRSEFVTAYTPYQPEVSQGLLQTIFEYQTYISEITGLPVSNASSYDGASACADALNIARCATKRRKVIVSNHLHPHHIETFDTYNVGWKMERIPLPYKDSEHFEIDSEKLRELLSGGDVACVAVEIPNFYGCFEKGISKLAGICSEYKTLLAIGYYPFCAAHVKRPGDFGADIAYGEGQPLGIPMGWGGPALGFLSCTKDLVRFLPGRLIGKTVDETGKTAYVMTLQAREQHIRRDKANSSICTNQALMALTATIYLSSIGKEGFREVGALESGAAHYLEAKLTAIDGITNANPGSEFFNEFTIKLDCKDCASVFDRLVARGFLPGIRLSDFGGAANMWLIATTEQHKKEDLDEFAAAIAEEVAK